MPVRACFQMGGRDVPHAELARVRSNCIKVFAAINGEPSAQSRV